MRLQSLRCGLVLAFFLVAGLAAQITEPVTGIPDVLESPQARTRALALLVATRQNLDIRRQGVPSFDFKVSYVASGNVAVTGAGTMEDVWKDASEWAWTATLAGVTINRVLGPPILSTAPATPVPLRIHMVRDAVFFWANGPLGEAASIRSALVAGNGGALECYLFAPARYVPPPTGRGNQEQEFCFDHSPTSALLRIWSPLPGVYYSYDYTGGPVFQDHREPGVITATEGGAIVLTIHIDSLTSLTGDVAWPQNLQTSGGLQAPQSFSVTWAMPSSAMTPGSRPQPETVILHLGVSPAGKLLDSEIFGASDPSLISIVQSEVPYLLRTHFPVSRNPNPNVGVTREAYFGIVFSASAATAPPPPLPPVTALGGTNPGPQPYEGTQVTDQVQTLADGNVIERKFSVQFARDSAGRTYRRQLDQPSGQPMVNAFYTINDPVAGISWQVFPDQRMARGTFMLRRPPPVAPGGTSPPNMGRGPGLIVSGGAIAPGQRIAPPPPPQGGPVVTTEQLGEEEVDGVNTLHTRTTMVYPAGSVGNENPITVIRDAWRSPELELQIRMVNNDPRMGVTTTEFQGLQVGEPSPDLFKIPDGYKMVDQQGNPIVLPASGTGGGAQ